MAQSERPYRTAAGQAEIQLGRFSENPHEALAHLAPRFFDTEQKAFSANRHYR